jgi:hypothetical protein
MPSQRLMRFIRFLTAYIIVVGGAILLPPRAWLNLADGSQTILATYA